MNISHNDPRLIRCATAMFQGINSRSYATDDQKRICRYYERYKNENPGKSFTECQALAGAKFISEVLAEEAT